MVVEIRLDEALKNISDELALEIKKIKQSYFSEAGKPGANWDDLKSETIRKKELAKYPRPSAFNYATGELKDSCDVSVTLSGDGLKISVKFDEDRYCDYLTEYLGRDFVTFTEDEKKEISKILCELLVKEISR